MESGLEKVVAHINEKGLPSKDEMRAVLDEQRQSEFIASHHAKLAEYKGLFDRWSGANDLTDAEMKKMGELSDELQKFADHVSQQQ